ncbi:unnamed protein product [Arctogadus glacialis]
MCLGGAPQGTSRQCSSSRSLSRTQRPPRRRVSLPARGPEVTPVSLSGFGCLARVLSTVVLCIRKKLRVGSGGDLRRTCWSEAGKAKEEF